MARTPKKDIQTELIENIQQPLYVQKAVEIITKWEGFSPTPYKDMVGVTTIGYGLTHYSANGNYFLNKGYITKEEALEEIADEVMHMGQMLNIDTFINLNDNQKASILSLAYNVGASAIYRSTLMKKVRNQDDSDSIASEFAKWRFAGGQEVRGLIARRQDEKQLFMQG